ncbi:TlpA family protein disulfide reductase [Bacillus horti]|uniref:Thiol-disulfide isomerase/thioredoxin n=1 Tax=Caldalkalibacillus horti TaxID=77523 RepID=A0ABT9VW73_9BACI|nr:TlpA disulfide reductase family protein [Bacillus horti]MDQ0165241.1 thiol-disulfide isomerase/thioredoxin [Bacillus horti]
MKSKGLFLVLFVIVVGVTFYSAFSGQTETMAHKPEVGFKAPPFELLGLNEEVTHRLESNDQPILINFWASWCGPCKDEAPDLNSVYEEYKDRVQFYAINMTDTDYRPNVDKFMEDYQFALPVLLDQDGIVSKSYQVLAVPTTFFVDKNNVIVHKHVGAATRSQLQEQLRKLVD